MFFVRAREEVDRLRKGAGELEVKYKAAKEEAMLAKKEAKELMQRHLMDTSIADALSGGPLDAQLMSARQEIRVLEAQVAERDRAMVQSQHRMGVLASQLQEQKEETEELRRLKSSILYPGNGGGSLETISASELESESLFGVLEGGLSQKTASRG